MSRLVEPDHMSHTRPLISRRLIFRSDITCAINPVDHVPPAGALADVAVDVTLQVGRHRRHHLVVGHRRDRLDLPDVAQQREADQLAGDQAAATQPLVLVVSRGWIRRSDRVSTTSRSFSRVLASWAAVSTTARRSRTDVLVSPGVQHVADQLPTQVGLRRRPRLEDGVEPLLRRRGGGIEQALLGAEVVVDQRRVDVRGPGDGPDCRAGPAVFGEFVASRGQNARRQYATLVPRARGD